MDPDGELQAKSERNPCHFRSHHSIKISIQSRRTAERARRGRRTIASSPNPTSTALSQEYQSRPRSARVLVVRMALCYTPARVGKMYSYSLVCGIGRPPGYLPDIDASNNTLFDSCKMQTEIVHASTEPDHEDSSRYGMGGDSKLLSHILAILHELNSRNDMALVGVQDQCHGIMSIMRLGCLASDFGSEFELPVRCI